VRLQNSSDVQPVGKRVVSLSFWAVYFALKGE
jgi:hypothetical protein